MERNRVEINRRLVISIKKLARKDRTEMMMMMIGEDSSEGEKSNEEETEESSGDMYEDVVYEGHDEIEEADEHDPDEPEGGFDEGGDVGYAMPGSG